MIVKCLNCGLEQNVRLNSSLTIEYSTLKREPVICLSSKCSCGATRKMRLNIENNVVRDPHGTLLYSGRDLK